MTLLNFKSVLFSLIFIGAMSMLSSAQYLGKHMIGLGTEVGFLQQKATVGYNYCLSNYKYNDTSDKYGQLYVGFDIGKTNFKNAIWGQTATINKGNFTMKGSGNYFGIAITHVMSKPMKKRPEELKYRYITLKFGANFIKASEALPAFDPYDEDDDFNPPEEVWLSDVKAHSSDFELHISKNITRYKEAHLKAGIYFGFRIGKITGYSNSYRPNVPPQKIGYNLNPLILGFSMSYQFNFGKNNR